MLAPSSLPPSHLAKFPSLQGAEPDGSNCDPSGAVAPQVEISLRGWDNRPATNTTLQLRREVEEGAAMLMILGDVSYARGFAAIWESMLDQLEPITTRVACMTLPGNHESNWPQYGTAFNTASLDSGGEAGLVYSFRFPMPPPASADAPWYSFDAGDAHIAMLSTEHDLSAASAQIVWLEQDLAAAAAAEKRWRIVAAHRFFFADTSSGASDVEAGAALLQDLEPLFVMYGVRLVIAGHHHSYQRTCAMVGGKCVSDGPVYIVSGNAGAGLSGISGAPLSIYERIALEHGYLRLSVNKTHLVGSAQRSVSASKMDSFVLTSIS
jgi:hypothetical protein